MLNIKFYDINTRPWGYVPGDTKSCNTAEQVLEFIKAISNRNQENVTQCLVVNSDCDEPMEIVKALAWGESISCLHAQMDATVYLPATTVPNMNNAANPYWVATDAFTCAYRDRKPPILTHMGWFRVVLQPQLITEPTR